jgi:hypothetical protein
MGFTEPDTPPQPPGQMPASSWDIQAPYAPGSPDAVYVGGDADAGGRDTVAGDVSGAVSNAEARFGELQGDTFGQGSHIGDAFTLPGGPAEHSKHTGGEDAGYPT